MGHPDTPPLAGGHCCRRPLGLLAGLLNGVMIPALLRVAMAIIATLATLTGFRGLILHLVRRAPGRSGQSLPDSLLNLTQNNVLGAGLGSCGSQRASRWRGGRFWGHTVRGREIYALGGNPEAAVLRGIRVRRVTIEIFVICGALAGLAEGCCSGSRFGTVNPGSVGGQMELVTISAVVIGGAAVAGGAGSVLGTLLGCLLLGVVNVAMIVHGVSELWQLVVYGAAIILACVIDAGRRRIDGEGRVTLLVTKPLMWVLQAMPETITVALAGFSQLADRGAPLSAGAVGRAIPVGEDRAVHSDRHDGAGDDAGDRRGADRSVGGVGDGALLSVVAGLAFRHGWSMPGGHRRFAGARGWCWGRLMGCSLWGYLVAAGRWW